MVEATVNPKYQRIRDYLMNTSKDNNISEEFVDRFVYNYINKDKWVSSEWIYQWFRLLGKTTRYNDFCDRYIKRLSSQYFKELPYSPTEQGQFQKKIYEISQCGIKLIMMQSDQQTREYYAQLEILMFNYVDRREDELQQTIDQKTKETEELKTYIEENKEEYVIYDKTVVETGEQYRGITNNLEMRNKSHKTSSCNPGLRQAIEQGKEIRTTIVKRFRSLSRKECKDIERAAILDIPKQYRLNKRIPGGMRPSTPFDHKPTEETQVHNQLQLYQQSYEESKSRNRISAKQSVVTNETVETVETDTNISQDSQGKLNTIIEQSCDDVMKCGNCKKTVEVRNQRYKTCQQCRQQNKLSKQKKASEQVPNGCKLCPRCSCVRPDSYFILKDKQMKTCANCRERNHKTTKAIKIHNDINLGKICIICHKINTNLDKKSCNECLEKKKQSRIKNLCIHQRDPYYCAIGDCGLQNSIKGVCLKHGSRLLKGICKKCQINNNKATNQNITQHLNQDTNTN